MIERRQAMGSIQAASAAIRSTAEEILREVDSMPRECIYWKPAPDVWSVMDNLCHIAEFVPYWTDQIVQVVHHPDREWGRTHSDPDRLAAVADTSSRDLETVKEQIRSAVCRSAKTIEQFTPAQLEAQAPARNPRWGIKPASFILDHLLVTHLQNHLSQIRRNLAQHEQARRGS